MDLIFMNMSSYISMKNYQNIAYTDFVNVNIAVNVHSYEELMK